MQRERETASDDETYDDTSENNHRGQPRPVRASAVTNPLSGEACFRGREIVAAPTLPRQPVEVEAPVNNDPAEQPEVDHREKMTYEVCRRRTFENQPTSMKQTPPSLARTGFYYDGTPKIPDRVRCFSCRRGLYNWDPVDDPAIQHALFYPDCSYIKHLMGDDFISDVQNAKHHQDLLDTPAAQAVLEFGYSKEDIYIAISFIEKNEGKLEALDAQMLMTAIMDLEDCGLIGKERRILLFQTIEEVAKSLKTENEFLRQKSLCKICMEKDVEVLLLSCGHVLCCDCSPRFTKCPFCRGQILTTTRIYFD